MLRYDNALALVESSSLRINPLPHATLPGLMQSPFGWLLLLACALVQGVVRVRGVRAAQVAAGAIGLAYVAAAGRATDGSLIPVVFTTLAFLVASATIIATHRDTAARMQDIIE